MKKNTIIIAIAALAASFSIAGCKNSPSQETEAANAADSTATRQTVFSGIADGSIVYFDIDRVLNDYKMAADLRAKVEEKVSGIQKEVDRRRTNLENAVKDFETKINKGLMTSATAADQQKKLQQQDQAFQQFAQQKQQEIMEEQQVMMNQLADAIKTFVEKYNAMHNHAMVLCNQAGFPVMTADPALDITDEILEGLNTEYSAK